QDYYRISVKREADHEPYGKVSNYLHDYVNEGDAIVVSALAGDFTLNMEEGEPVALISGGVGLTPMMSMLNTLLQENSRRDITFMHPARHEKVHAICDDEYKLTAHLENSRFRYGYSNAEATEGD